MTNKELEQRVKELEQERDLWRDVVSKVIKAMPAQPVVLLPCVAPQPQVWPPFVQPTVSPLVIPPTTLQPGRWTEIVCGAPCTSHRFTYESFATNN